MAQISPDKYKNYIDVLKNKFNNIEISENIYDTNYTSYSGNKGEQIVFCMRSRNSATKDNIHDINLMMYVVLHEISHIACPEWGHTPLFKEIFSFITKSASDLKLYVPIDFKNTPQEYCGMTINESII